MYLQRVLIDVNRESVRVGRHATREAADAAKKLSEHLTSLGKSGEILMVLFRDVA